MARGTRKSSKAEIDRLYRRCRYCNAHRETHFFDRHQSACKKLWIIRNETRESHSVPSAMVIDTTDIQWQGGSTNHDEFMEGSSAAATQLEGPFVEETDFTKVDDAEEPPSE